MVDSFQWPKGLEVGQLMRNPLADLQRAARPLDTIQNLDPFAATRRLEQDLFRQFASMGQLDALSRMPAELERQALMMGRSPWTSDPYSYGSPAEAFVERERRRFADFATFRLPQIDEIGTLARSAAETFASMGQLSAVSSLEAQIARMRDPWLRVGAEEASLRGFAEIFFIGDHLRRSRPFDPAFGQSLRGALGDWRAPGITASAALIDPIVRTTFYRARGFGQELSDFTPQAFDANLRISGLRDRQDEPDETDQEVDRATEAFRRLRSFEIELRRFIDRVMSEAYGRSWIKQRMPPTVLEGWKKKREAAKAAGMAPAPLIDFADLTDYVQVISRSDNWSDVFQPIFIRVEDIRESLQRLQPIRVATMHSRVVTQDDEVLLWVETKRILKAINQER